VIGWLRSRVLTPRRPDEPGLEYPDDVVRAGVCLPELSARQREQLAALVASRGQFDPRAVVNGRMLAHLLRRDGRLPPVAIAGLLITTLDYAMDILVICLEKSLDPGQPFMQLTDAMGMAAIELTKSYREATAVRHERAGG
jgi:hypothetical protein